MGRGRLRWAVAAAAFGLLLRVPQVASVEEAEPAPAVRRGQKDGSPTALFTHADNQLHCPDRHLEHPCVEELGAYLANKSDEQDRAAALDCVNEVLSITNNYWELKNMTHLLLDLDTKEHVFDKTSRDNEFVMAGLRFADKLMRHEECLREFDVKSELEGRCVALYAKISVLKYKNAGMLREAMDVFRRVTSLAWEGAERSYAPGEAVPWDDFAHTPQIILERACPCGAARRGTTCRFASSWRTPSPRSWRRPRRP
ncbi:unnamed protein product [Prorocentrum cordatum]|uniref:KIF-binding protein n=1 Tax=Prorocentrum cordatum TaxID=2364126 RepID=A0ABN9VGF2_9DINO|nr:unnamed protein product [Polarella glacialis]